jgi:DNA-binding transcriptional LysR family regulator
LLYRSTRRLSLTHEGGKLFDAAKAMLAAAQIGLNAIAGRSAEPSGRLSVTVPAFLARGEVIDDIAAFAHAFPKIALSIGFSDIKQDLIRDGIDIAIRIGSLKDSALKSKKLFNLERKLVAAPSLMEHRKKPRHPEELSDWDWIGLQMRPHNRTLVNKKGEAHRIDFAPRIIVDSLDAVCQLALAGLGLATPPAFMVEEDLRAGRLIEPLPSWQLEPLGVYAVWPPNSPKDGLTYRIVRFLEARRKAR